MTPRAAISILMLSPIYFKLRPVQRWSLIREYCQLIKKCEVLILVRNDETVSDILNK